jgi:hypothetical protein
MQLYPEAAKRDAEKTGSARTIAVTTYEGIENVSSFNLSQAKAAPNSFHSSTRLIELKQNTTRSNG